MCLSLAVPRHLKALETEHGALGLSNNPGVMQYSGILPPRGLPCTQEQLQCMTVYDRGIAQPSTKGKI